MMKSLRRRIIYALASTVTLYALAVVVSAQLAGCEAPPHVLRDRAADDPTQLRVMTLNVHYGSQPAASAEAISRGNADIICLQESTPAWEEYARTSRCDHILTPAQLKCVDAAVLKLGASDHYPVVAVMEKRGASSAAR
jgi:endonuclease/exonuclease/phosphatase family metal-dependent hydrolase